MKKFRHPEFIKCENFKKAEISTKKIIEILIQIFVIIALAKTLISKLI